MKTTISKSGINKFIVRRFESINDFVKYIDETPKNDMIFQHKESSKSSDFAAREFTMTANWDEARNLLFNGWDEGAKKLTTALRIENAKMQNKEVKRAIYDVVGFQASVPRYLQGIPTSMVNKKTTKQKQKTVTLHKSVSYNGGVTAKAILDDSVKFLQIVQGIEAKGIRVNAYVTAPAKNRGEITFYSIKIKSANERLNLSKMSFPLMHPSMLRRYFFRATEVEREIHTRSWSHGYGMPISATEVKNYGLLEKDEIYIPELISEKDAVKYVSDTLANPKGVK